MQLSDDQVVRLLISRYKQSDIDLSQVVHDPVFNDLPLSAKVDALKKYAGELAAGTSSRFTKKDLNPVFLGTGFGALAAASAVPGLLSKTGLGPRVLGSLQQRMSHNKALIGTMIIAGTAGAIVGGITSLVDAHGTKSIRVADKNILQKLSTNPTDGSAVFGLSAIKSRSAGGTGFTNRLSNLVNQRFNDNQGGLVSDYYKNKRVYDAMSYPDEELNPYTFKTKS